MSNCHEGRTVTVDFEGYLEDGSDGKKNTFRQETPYIDGASYEELAANATEEMAKAEGVSVFKILDDHYYRELTVRWRRGLSLEMDFHRVSKDDVLYILKGRAGSGSDYEQPDIREGSTQYLIATKCDQVKSLLLRKNADYGNSALDPVRIFSKADAEEQIRVRIDDKLSRLAGAGEKNFSEDTVMDLIGYLILLAVKMEEADGKN